MSLTRRESRSLGEPLAYRPSEAAEALGISKRLLSQLVADRDSGIPHCRIGRCLLFPREALNRWLEGRIEGLR